MAGPGGKVVGRVSVRVLPDSSDFGRELAGDLAAIERTLSVEIPVEVNARQLAQDMGRIRSQVSAAARNVEIGVTVNTAGVVAQVEALSSVMPAVQVPVEVNLAQATAELAAVERLAAGLSPTVRVGVAVDPNLRTRLSGLRSALSGSGGGALDPVLRTRMELLKARLSAAGAVQLQVDVDVASAVAKVETAKRVIESLDGPRIDIGTVVNREALQASLEDARQQLDALVAKSRSVRLGNALGADNAIEIPTGLLLDKDQIRQDLGDLRLRLIQEFGGGLPLPFSFDQDVEGSLADLRQRVEQLVASNEFELPATLATPLNENRLFGDLAILSRRLAANGGDYEWGVALTADQDQLQRSLAEMQQRIQRLLAAGQVQPLTVEIRPDDAFSTNLRRQIAVAVSGVEANIPLGVQGEVFRARLQAAVRAAEETLQVDVPLDVAQAALFRTKALAAVAEVQALVDRVNPTIDVDVDVDRRGAAEQKLAALRGALTGVASAFARVLRLTEAQLGIERFATQLALILARTAAYAVLLGPPLVLAASGALALAPAFATALPFALGLAAQVGVIALGMDALFGPKVDGKRLGGPFQGLREQLSEVKVDIGELITRGLTPLAEAFRTTTFTAYTNGLKDVAAGVNLAITNLLLFGTTQTAIQGTERVFAALARQTTVFAQLVEPLGSALLKVTVAAIPGFDTLNGALLRGGLRFAAFIDRAAASGQLSAVISRAVDDLLAFLTAIGRVTGQIIEFLAALEPAARAAFGGLADNIESGLEAANQFLQGFELSGSTIEGLLLGIVGVVAELKSVPGDVLAAFAPLLESDQFDQFLDSLGALLVSTAGAVATLTNVAANLVETFNIIVGVPLLGFLADITGGLASSLDFLARNEALFGTLAILLAARYVPAVGAAAAAMRGFVLVNIAGAISTALGAVTAFIRAIPAYIAGVRAFGLAAVGTSVNLRALATAAVTSQIATTAAFAGITLLAVSLVTDFQNAGQAAKQSIEQIAEGFDALDPTALDRTSEEIQKIRYETLAAGEGASFWTKVLSGPLSSRLIDAKVKQQGIATATEATNAALAELEQKTANVNTNLSALVPATGATAATLREVARSLGVDLSKAFSESGPDRDKILAFMTDLQTETGLTVGVLATFADSSGKSLQQVGKEAEDAAKKVATAFARDTDVLGTLDLGKAQETLTKAITKRADAQRRLDDVEERLAGKKKLTIADTQALERAQLAVAEANKKVGESSKGIGVDAIRSSYRATIALAETFTADISAAYKAGLDPAVIARLLEAGPQQATPILEAILSDHSGRMVDLVNESEAKLAALNQQVLAQQRILWVAIQSEAAAGSDKYLLQVDDAMRISAELFASGGTASIDAIAKKLKLSPDRVTEIAQNFGFSQLLDQLQGQADRNPIDVRFRVPKTLPTPGGGSRPNPIGNKPLPDPTRFRSGGLVTGPGSKTSDSILARISRGEFVQQAAAVDHYGADVMRAINERRIPREILSGTVLKQLTTATKAVQVAVADVKLATAAARRPQAVPADRVIGVDVAKAGALPAGYPKSLQVVDSDGVLRGQMRVAASNDHRSRMHRERRRRLGSGGS